MMLELSDDGTVTSVNEEELVYVDKNELEELVDNYHQLEKENKELKHQLEVCQKPLSNLEDLEQWRWEDLLGALNQIANSVGYETELFGKEYIGSYEEEIEQLQKEYHEINEENEQLKQDGSYWAKTAEARRKEIDTLQLENELLKEALKKEHMSISGVLCDACKYQEAIYTNNWFVGEDFDVKCNKGHEVLIDEDEQECTDFELRIGD